MTSFILKPAGAHTQGLKLLEAQDNRIRRDTTDTLWLNVNVYTSSVAITPSAHHSTSATKPMHHCHQKGHLIHHHTVHRVIHGAAQKTRTWVPLNAPHAFTLCSRSCRQWWVQLFSSWKQERSVLSLSKKNPTTCVLFLDISKPINSKSLFATIKHHLHLKSAPKRVPNARLRSTMTRVPRCVCVWAWVYVSGRGRGNDWERKKGKPRLCNTRNNRNHLSLLLNHNRDKKTHTAPERADGISPRNVFA